MSCRSRVHCFEGFWFVVVLFSYALFDMDGHQVPQTLVTEVGEVFETLLEEVI